MIKLITFTDDRMTISADKLKESALRNGCDDVKIYTPEDLGDHFMTTHYDLIGHERGFMYWSWKPFIILDALVKASYGDYIMYSDAGCLIISNVRAIIDRMEDDITLFGNGWKHCEWTKADILHAINGANMKITPTMSGDVYSLGELAMQEQTQASLIYFRVSERSRKFVKEWYAWSLHPGFIDDSPSIIPNIPTFADNRHDQSLLCSVGIKWGLKMNWFPSSTNLHNPKYQSAGYPVLLEHHRKRNTDW